METSARPAEQTADTRAPGWADLEAELSRLLTERAITPLFQPLVDLDSSRVVAYEALARGPTGSPLEYPVPLFATAVEAGRLAELDWICRARALSLARSAKLPAGTGLFVNMEPATLSEPCPPDLVADC